MQITTMAKKAIVNDNQGIQNSWSLIAFAKVHGKMEVGEFTNKDTGEEFSSCVFTNDKGDRTFVGFSSNLGELSAKEISRRRDDLQVVELESGYLCLCAKGNNSWEEVDLGL